MKRSSSNWNAKVVGVLGVAAVALLLLTGVSKQHEAKEPGRSGLSVSQILYEADNAGMNGGTSGIASSKGDASDFMNSADLGDYVDAIIGPSPSGLTDGGFKKRGSIAVSKIDASGFYYLNIQGEAGHALKTILQGSDGYHRHWKGYGQIYTGPIHEGNYGGKDYLQIQDLVTGEVEYFRFRFT
ncbi:hypothetical protein GUITHDRAFT_155208 [Guillardia theta CCMP2712]|uniref:Uncharacterized protein n=2 Tax=Guillardia theta TaxID=55529 RepID=L1ILD0_GUITC|nr:hypothetical protein GUITHDRAFT_155208 [Guillardia theta CCMP2712]EKX36605.1 hypothetical protein GUITHDRAFT_155208 [Guillardia theta CCMP2712]|eukprot:XP_005823585.1 hypothetical protein GUITHDRAFT_155208 [Guillardia theta CCMP2712]